MTIQEIYELGLEMAIDSDPRGREAVQAELKRAKKSYDTLPEKKKKTFDKEDLVNPYTDSRILLGDPKQQVKKILAGIDMTASEVLLADRLNEKGMGIDLLIAHHPEGSALATLDGVMGVQVDMYEKAGVPVGMAEGLFDDRRAMVKRRFSPLNLFQSLDTAKLLGFSYMSMHTFWDNLGNKFVTDYLESKKFDTVGEVFEAINEIPEFNMAIGLKNPPMIVSGNENRKVGKLAVGYTGGTNGPKEAYIELAKAGVTTLVEMHIPEDALSELKKLHVNVIDCGHMAADSIGANLFFDALEKKGVEVIPCSGIMRVKRN
jgi:putative NIF3 family GTP cyclohydrolase 1 type 2